MIGNLMDCCRQFRKKSKSWVSTFCSFYSTKNIWQYVNVDGIADCVTSELHPKMHNYTFLTNNVSAHYRKCFMWIFPGLLVILNITDQKYWHSYHLPLIREKVEYGCHSIHLFRMTSSFRLICVWAFAFMCHVIFLSCLELGGWNNIFLIHHQLHATNLGWQVPLMKIN